MKKEWFSFLKKKKSKRDLSQVTIDAWKQKMPESAAKLRSKAMEGTFSGGKQTEIWKLKAEKKTAVWNLDFTFIWISIKEIRERLPVTVPLLVPSLFHTLFCSKASHFLTRSMWPSPQKMTTGQFSGQIRETQMEILLEFSFVFAQERYGMIKKWKMDKRLKKNEILSCHREYAIL